MRCRTLAGCAGFTLIEILCVLVLLAIIASVAVTRMVALDTSASHQMLRSGLSELNSREKMAWCKVKLNPTGWVDDPGVFAEVDTLLGSDYQWSSPPSVLGGVILFKNQAMPLKRNPSSLLDAGTWKEGS
jgi:prepilin-type N-terminal cleavage/methylation domain-containing protein